MDQLSTDPDKSSLRTASDDARMVRLPSVVRAMTEPTHADEAKPLIHARTTITTRARSRLQVVDQQRPKKLGAAGERAPVIRSKIQPPPLRSSTLSRQRLLDRLSDAVESRLTLIVAEAGYGKTTLLADFSARAPVRCLWYKLDPTDADPVTWTNYLIAAVREIDPEFGQRTLSLLSQVASGGPPDSVFVASFLAELSLLGEAPTVLVLDDFHLVDESTNAREFVTRLIREAPPWLHFVLATRRRPSLDLARFGWYGRTSRHQNRRPSVFRPRDSASVCRCLRKSSRSGCSPRSGHENQGLGRKPATLPRLHSWSRIRRCPGTSDVALRG